MTHKLFNETNSIKFFKDVVGKMRLHIQTECDIKKPEVELIKSIIDKFSIKPLEIDFVKKPQVVMYAESRNEPQYAKVYYYFNIISGDERLLFVKPQISQLKPVGIEFIQGARIEKSKFSITFPTNNTNIILAPHEKESARNYIDPIIENAKKDIETLNNEVSDFNLAMPDDIKKEIVKRKDYIKSIEDQNNDL